MDKNKIIRANLEAHLNTSMKLFKGQFSFSNIIKQELDNFENITWLPSPDFDVESLKEEKKSELITLLDDKQLHSDIEQVLEELTDINEKSIQDNIEHQLIENLLSIAQNIPKEKKDFKLNLLFLTHNYTPQASFSGFDDPKFKYKLLSGQEYLKYDYKKDLFNGVGRFDYSTLLSPLLNLEEELDEEKVDMINEALMGGDYLAEIKKLFLLNGFLGIHLCLDRIKDDIRRINIPMRDEVFIFGNEHDSEQLNIYVL